MILVGLYFLVYGAAECHWTERQRTSSGFLSDRDRNRTHTVHYKGEEVYLNQRTYLFGHPGADAVEVQQGTHRYDFACQLPPMLPASFEASLGHIRYKVKAVLDIPWGFDKEFNLQLTIIRHDDLNLNPALKMPSYSERIQSFGCCLFCNSAPVMMSVVLPYSGFVPGQVVPVTITYKNRSTTDINSTRLSLIRHTRFNSHTPEYKTRFDSEKMVKYQAGGCRRGEEQIINCELTLPMTMLKSNSTFCRVVQISYEVIIEGVTGGCSKNLRMSIPIEIGSIPLNFNPAALMQPAVGSNQFGVFPPNAPTAPMDTFDLRKNEMIKDFEIFSKLNFQLQHLTK
jgi:Arrestin (or S-antigen), N-terminal domain/Arrestin (or S-antigen), C-terminal domain